MNQDDYSREISAQRPSNIARLLAGFVFLTVSVIYRLNAIFFISVFFITASAVWLYFVERKYSIIKKHENLWFFIASIDITTVSLFVYFTGAAYSPVIMGYIFMVTLSSTDLKRIRGRFSAAFSIFSFLVILILVTAGIIEYVNILSSSGEKPGIFASVIAFLLLLIACFSVNDMIYSIYYQYNEKNTALSSALDSVKKLKDQQDGDYFLTSLLLEPFYSEQKETGLISMEILMRQYKRFIFKGKEYDLGGDACLSDVIFVKGEKYFIFLNGDAMGKSMQGAGGAVVLCSVFRSITEHLRTSVNTAEFRPELWLLQSFGDLHKVFESFMGLMLASCIFGILEESSGELLFMNAEHPFLILYRDEKARFIESESSMNRKLGTLEMNSDPIVQRFHLVHGDILFLGSDGKDDLGLADPSGMRVVDSEETRILSVIESAKGDIQKTAELLFTFGAQVDDLSIMKIKYFNDASKSH
ncbi:MAG TPA: PP2C family protein-serine/threonine phosphatase [Leptospiraceae bacterium]|nr:PP2C family protein-serine/threonine phosphatase [Leptospiraceae bacterium]HMY67126.1 PP2C family protein-serine/threonine phosphatase [Leptospiraceae bacterium]HNI25201.1 PP2C family protein-serine/threonine phosphatase [Leptospiraceae bacterium]HNM01882.1 PP2C family protein-serine/threonine phosphatase [Leptospiraceae bacterium]